MFPGVSVEVFNGPQEVSSAHAHRELPRDLQP